VCRMLVVVLLAAVSACEAPRAGTRSLEQTGSTAAVAARKVHGRDSAESRPGEPHPVRTELPTRLLQLDSLRRIVDVAVDSGSSVYVLDGEAPALWLVRDGAVSLVDGPRPGAVRHELIAPKTVLFAIPNSVLVLDIGTRSVVRYTIGEPSRNPTAIRFDFSPQDMCLIGDRLFILGYRDGALIHEFEVRQDALRRTRSFARAPDGGRAFRRAMANGHLACVTQPSPIVAYASVRLPTVRLFRTDRGDSSVHRLADFVPVEIRETEAGGVVLSFPPSGWHHAIVQLAPLGPGAIVAQITTVIAESDRRPTGLETRVLSTDGALIGTLNVSGVIVGAIGDTIVSFENDPVPRLRFSPLLLNGSLEPDKKGRHR